MKLGYTQKQQLIAEQRIEVFRITDSTAVCAKVDYSKSYKKGNHGLWMTLRHLHGYKDVVSYDEEAMLVVLRVDLLANLKKFDLDTILNKIATPLRINRAFLFDYLRLRLKEFETSNTIAN